eukprot:CAMPEP_0202731832 /NCGR_PEP_ID=MMETSP1385-20130828/187346_1 /ASSEMBLY_ACC=CAM_ASM_000861 /TAXON_ID=933848 /ORGANISM="Elphidium margaritaceum" /LENGTH=931 /DNA_ID=CAMNT_0049398135 /DNA_START=64 /DNA_END=2859 /DNA_ORIENTATION=-
MSVVGFDLGCALSKVAVAYRKKIEIVPNELTKLLTPTLAAFSAKERHFGDGALTQYMRNNKNTISQLKRWIGCRADDERVVKEAAFWLPGIETGALDDGRFGIYVTTPQGKLLMAPEQILAGFLGQLKKFTSKYLGGVKVTDCVIACPSYLDDAQRRALLTAARLAELKVLRLLEESTAIALNYGILRNLPENETQRVIFFDFGFAATQVAIVDFVRGKLSVRYKSSNPFVGGRDLDRALYELFRAQWKEKHKVDIDDKPKQKLKLLQACGKIKKQLTGNKDALWTLDCFHEDHDFQLFITRDEMEARADSDGVFRGMLEPLIEALEATKEDNVKIHSCEIVAGSARVPCVQQRVLQVVQQHASEITALSTTLNMDECVARGSALMCAMLSPNFRVREFQVQDILTWPITISYPSEHHQEEQKQIEQVVMQRGNPQPCTAKVMFNKTQNFVFKLQHPSEYKVKDTTAVTVTYPYRTNREIGEFNVQLLPLNEKAIQAPRIKLLLDINKQGLLDWPKASLIEWIPREAKKEEETTTTKDAESAENDAAMKDKTDADADDKGKDKKDKDKGKGKGKEKGKGKGKDKGKDSDKKAATDQPKEKETEEEKMDVDEDDDTPAADGNAADAESDKKKKDKEKKKLTRDLIITGNFFNKLKADAYNQMFELEANLLNMDRIVHETDEAKNELETCIYALRDKSDGSHREFLEEKDRATLSEKLTTMEDWLYDEGDSANKTHFHERLKELKDVEGPMDYRAWEFEHRIGRVTNLKKLIVKYQQWTETTDEKYAHIEDDKRKEIAKAANDMDAWLTHEQIKQDKLAKFEAPTLRVKDIDAKYRELYDKCNPIITTPKPKPPPPAPKEEDKETGATNGDDKETVKTDEENSQQSADATMTDQSNENGGTESKAAGTQENGQQKPANEANNTDQVTDGMDVE